MCRMYMNDPTSKQKFEAISQNGNFRLKVSSATRLSIIFTKVSKSVFDTNKQT